ncbi:hypothetical protein OROMI_033359 [Orobanche minor]
MVAAAPTCTWKTIWKLRTPPKIVHFIWRCVYGALPFADTLSRRGVTIDDACPFCEVGPSQATHLFFECNFAMDIWRKAAMDSKIADVNSVSSQQRFIDILGTHDSNIDLFCIICYMLWYYRNKALYEGVRVDEDLIFHSSATLPSDYCKFNAWPERSAISLISRLWSKPPAHGIRVFFDGALSPRPAGGTGVFVCDETGRFIHATSKFYVGINNPLVIELLALRDAFRLALHLGLHSFSLLGDSQQTVLAVNREEDVPFICASVLEDINSLSLLAPFLGIFWIRRSENLAAHDLAFYAKNTFDCNES